MDFVAESTLGADAEALAEEQHPDHELRIDRGPAHLAVEWAQMRADFGEIEEPIDGPHPMIGRDVLLQAELVKQRLLQHRPLAHHQPAPETRER